MEDNNKFMYFPAEKRLIVFVKRSLGYGAATLLYPLPARAVVEGGWQCWKERGKPQRKLRSGKEVKERDEERAGLCLRPHSASHDEAPTDIRLSDPSRVELFESTCCGPRSQLDQGLTALYIRKDVISA